MDSICCQQIMIKMARTAKVVFFHTPGEFRSYIFMLPSCQLLAILPSSLLSLGKSCSHFSRWCAKWNRVDDKGVNPKPLWCCLYLSEGACMLSEFWVPEVSCVALKQFCLVNNLIFASFSAPAPGQRANPQLSSEPCFPSTLWCLSQFNRQFSCLLGESASLQLEFYFSLLFLRSHVNWPDHEDLLVPVSSQWFQRL